MDAPFCRPLENLSIFWLHSNISQRSYLYLVLHHHNNVCYFWNSYCFCLTWRFVPDTFISNRSTVQREFIYKINLLYFLIFPHWESLYSSPSLFWEKMSHSNNVYKSIVPPGCIRKVEIQMTYRYEDAHGLPMWDCYTGVRMWPRDPQHQDLGNPCMTSQ